jgi:3-hydroxyisobutyrate dehydrogenase
MNTNETKPRIAFLGLGLMGSGMARRLLNAGFPLTVFNRDAAKSSPFAAEGARIAATPREASADAKIVISMLADDTASRSVWLGENGALAGAQPGTVLIESGTVTVGWVQELHAAAKARNCGLLDAPVTGSKPQAESGDLCFLVGGNTATLEKVGPALAAMSRSITHLGPAGSGALIINNFLCGVQAASLAEAVGMIERGGLDRAKALEVLASGAPGSPLLKNFSGRMTARDYSPLFKLRLMAKDLGYARHEAANVKMNLATAEGALRLYDKAIADGLGDKDISSIVEQFRNR